VLVGLRRILVPHRRRKAPRADAPRTIVPPREPATPAARIDAARARLQAEIPPKSDDAG
jgi:hypothetical protein